MNDIEVVIHRPHYPTFLVSDCIFIKEARSLKFYGLTSYFYKNGIMHRLEVFHNNKNYRKFSRIWVENGEIMHDF